MTFKDHFSGHAADYAALDVQCEALTTSEEKVGEFVAALSGAKPAATEW